MGNVVKEFAEVKLVNLRLQNEPLSIYIEAYSHVWDMHNGFDLEVIHQNILERSVTIFWRHNDFSELPLPVVGVEIVFTEVNYFEITPRDAEILDYTEDLCLEGLSRVLPEDDTRTLITDGIPLLELEDDIFHLWFSFRGGQHIRIGAESAVFNIK